MKFVELLPGTHLGNHFLHLGEGGKGPLITLSAHARWALWWALGIIRCSGGALPAWADIAGWHVMTCGTEMTRDPWARRGLGPGTREERVRVCVQEKDASAQQTRSEGCFGRGPQSRERPRSMKRQRGFGVGPSSVLTRHVALGAAGEAGPGQLTLAEPSGCDLTWSWQHVGLEFLDKGVRASPRAR